MSYDSNNPSDQNGTTRSQQTVIGVVVSNKDPQQTGRVKVRIVGEQDDMKVSDDDLPWYPVMTNGFPQVGGVGRFPTGGMYLPGSRIVMRNLGQQGFVIEGAIQNSQTQQGKEGRHPESTSTSPVIVRDGKEAMHRRVHEGSKAMTEIQENTQKVMQVLNGEVQNIWERVSGDEKIKKIVEEAKTSVQYLERAAARVKQGESPMPVSVDPWDYARNAQKFVQKVPNSELIKNSVNMLENLKKVAQQSMNPQQIMSLGGAGNIMGALQSIMQFLQKHTPKKKKDEETEEEKRLREELEKLEERSRDPAENLSDTPIV